MKLARFLSTSLFASLLAIGGASAVGCQPDDEPGAYHELDVEYTADDGLVAYKIEESDPATAWPPYVGEINFALWAYPGPDPAPMPDVSDIEPQTPEFLHDGETITAPIPTYVPDGPGRWTLKLTLSRPGPWKVPVKFKTASGGSDSAEIILDVRASQ